MFPRVVRLAAADVYTQEEATDGAIAGSWFQIGIPL